MLSSYTFEVSSSMLLLAWGTAEGSTNFDLVTYLFGERVREKAAAGSVLYAF